MDTLKHRVFTYGTLKTGQPNHHIVNDKSLGEAKLVGTARTVDKFPLVIANKYNTPYLLDAKGTGKAVRGELYEIDDKMLASLDNLEGHPLYYRRALTTVTILGDQSSCPQQCFTYIMSDFKPEVLSHAFLEDYDPSSHGQPPYIRPDSVDADPVEVWAGIKHTVYGSVANDSLKT